MCICLKMTSVVLSDVNGLTPFDCSDGRLEFCHAGKDGYWHLNCSPLEKG